MTRLRIYSGASAPTRAQRITLAAVAVPAGVILLYAAETLAERAPHLPLPLLAQLGAVALAVAGAAALIVGAAIFLTEA